MEETQSKLDKAVGTKEIVTLMPKAVEVASVKLEPKTIRDKKTEILVVGCKHPDSDKPIEISKVKLLKGNTVKSTGLWYSEDEDGNIQKGSAIATLLNFYSVSNPRELIGKTVNTTTENESSNYLVIKAY